MIASRAFARLDRVTRNRGQTTVERLWACAGGADFLALVGSGLSSFVGGCWRLGCCMESGGGCLDFHSSSQYLVRHRSGPTLAGKMSIVNLVNAKKDMHILVSAPEPPRQVAKTWPRCTGLGRQNVCAGFEMRCTVLLCQMSSLAAAIAGIRRTTSRPFCARCVTSITENIKCFAGS